MVRGSVADNISEMVNKTSFNPMQVGVEMTTDHRYLVNEFFKATLHFCGQLKRNCETGNFDGRNEFACKCSKVMIDALTAEGLYQPEYWGNEYDDILKKCWD